MAPEELMNYENQAKIEVLKTLLEQGTINLEEMKSRVGDVVPAEYLKKAFGIIRRYVENDGVGLRGGTGLPEVE